MRKKEKSAPSKRGEKKREKINFPSFEKEKINPPLPKQEGRKKRKSILPLQKKREKIPTLILPLRRRGRIKVGEEN